MSERKEVVVTLTKKKSKLLRDILNNTKLCVRTRYTKFVDK